jgi:hypothetical protein
VLVHDFSRARGLLAMLYYVHKTNNKQSNKRKASTKIEPTRHQANKYRTSFLDTNVKMKNDIILVVALLWVCVTEGKTERPNMKPVNYQQDSGSVYHHKFFNRRMSSKMNNAKLGSDPRSLSSLRGHKTNHNPSHSNAGGERMLSWCYDVGGYSCGCYYEDCMYDSDCCSGYCRPYDYYEYGYVGYCY